MPHSARDDQPVILVIDDDKDTVQLLIRWIHDEGYKAAWAEDGPTGLTMAERYRPHAIILDFNLPGLDGISLCKEFKGKLSTADTPVLFITGETHTDEFLVRAFEAGAHDLISKPCRKADLICRLRVALREQELREAYRRLAIQDPLTGLSNRRQFFVDVTEAIGVSKRDRTECFLAIADIDQLAVVNEKYGHEFGDEVILTFSRLLKRLVSPNCKVGRIGGEEFAFILTDYTADRAIGMAQRIRQTFSSITFDASSQPKHFFAGIGVARFDGGDPGFTADHLMNQADIALFAAKEFGRGRVTSFWELDPASLPVVAPHKRHARARERKRTQRSFFGTAGPAILMPPSAGDVQG